MPATQLVQVRKVDRPQMLQKPQGASQRLIQKVLNRMFNVLLLPLAGVRRVIIQEHLPVIARQILTEELLGSHGPRLEDGTFGIRHGQQPARIG